MRRMKSVLIPRIYLIQFNFNVFLYNLNVFCISPRFSACNMVTFTVPLVLFVTQHTEVRTSACMYLNCTVVGSGKFFYEKRVAIENSHWWRGSVRLTLTVEQKTNK
jgi:hypothetical protein